MKGSHKRKVEALSPGDEAQHVFVCGARDEFQISEVEVRSHQIDLSVLQAVEDEVNRMMAESGNIFLQTDSGQSNNTSPAKPEQKRKRPTKKLESEEGEDEWMPSKESVSKPKKSNKRKPSRPKSAGKFKCPECDFRANQVSSIHSHSAFAHHYSMLAELYKKRAMIDEKGFCSECPDRGMFKLGRYVYHVGGKHNLYLQFVPPELADAYGKLPTKKNNCGYIQNELQKSLKCLICTTEKAFVNVTQYKQHLSIIHYVHDIARNYKSTFPHHWLKKTCSQCDSTKEYSRGEALVTHLVSSYF